MYRSAGTTALFTAALACGLVTSASAQKPLAGWNLKSGEEFFVSEHTRREQTLAITRPGSDAEVGKDSRTDDWTTFSRIRVLSVSPRGDVDLDWSLLDIRDASGKTTQLGKRLRSTSFQVRLNADGSIERFTGYDEFVNRIAAGNHQFAQLFETLLGKETLKKMLLEFLQVAPPSADRGNQPWTREIEFSMGPLGSMAVTRTYVPVTTNDAASDTAGNEAERKSARPGNSVKISGKVKYTPPSQQSGHVSFKVESGKLDVEQLNGIAEFDPTTGRLVSLESDLKLNGSFSMTAGDDRVQVEMTQTDRTTIKISPDDPR